MKGRSVQSDAEAIQQCRSGHPDAFRVLVERYQAEAFGHALALLGHREDALDCVQDSFLAVYQAIERFDVSRDFYPWFCVILRNRCYKQFDARKRRSEAESVNRERCLLIVAPDDVRVGELEDALWALAPQDREIITLRHLEGLKYVELAERLSIPVGTVMSRLYYARSRLRDLLGELDDVSTEDRSKS
ncbi:MAG: sigma-70 family RNA polymerase sigma factor [Planctomycetes bacterium]|nr:sigma-70 family RNA polymerase sigma factor [Planctomycetota bacterium]